jgi:hypothetical protein
MAARHLSRAFPNPPSGGLSILSLNQLSLNQPGLNRALKSMTREQLEHVIRALAAIARIEDIVVIGSQAVPGEFPDAPEELLVSQEADVPYESSRQRRSDRWLDRGGSFQRSFGYYAHGIDDRTAILPQGWREHLILVTGEGTHEARGWCLEVHDLAIAKYAAGREKERLTVTPIDGALRRLTEVRIDGDFAG